MTPEDFGKRDAELSGIEPVTGASILEGIADAMTQAREARGETGPSQAEAELRRAIATAMETARRCLKGARAGRAIFGEDPGQGVPDGTILGSGTYGKGLE